MDSDTSLLFVSTYTNFDNLAHAPKGTPDESGLHVFRINEKTLDAELLTVSEAMNPAFMRFHPKLNVLYACTESIHEDGRILAYQVSPSSGRLTLISDESATGTSTCYLTLDRSLSNMLFVNYWDASIGALGVDGEGKLHSVKSIYRPKQGLVATARSDHLTNRQSEPHSHAVVLDPYWARIAYVPDLGEDNVKQFVFNSNSGDLSPAGSVAAGPAGVVHGPRYIVFHSSVNVAYLVNELSSTVAVFEVDLAGIQDLIHRTCSKETLKRIQIVSTIPEAFPKNKNTCSRIAVHPSGKFVLVGNRGHNSIAVYKVDLNRGGTLSTVGIFSTKGRTPRHFQFNEAGTLVFAANQDSGSVSIFRFDCESGSMTYTGHQLDVPSPNFIVCDRPRSEVPETYAPCE